MQLSNQFAIVASMNAAYNNPAVPKADYACFLQEGKARFNDGVWTNLRNQCQNIADEIEEFTKAMKKGDWLEMRDAICDIRVFALGAFHFMSHNPTILQVGSAFDSNSVIPKLLSVLTPHTLLTVSHEFLMGQIAIRDYQTTITSLNLMLYATMVAAAKVGISPALIDQDMQVVVGAVLTRFVKNEHDAAETVALHAAKGVYYTYWEGEYPNRILKSEKDQPDAPAGKFLKSASYQKPVFAEAAPDLDLIAQFQPTHYESAQ
jgi:hypothetical protein